MEALLYLVPNETPQSLPGSPVENRQQLIGHVWVGHGASSTSDAISYAISTSDGIATSEAEAVVNQMWPLPSSSLPTSPLVFLLAFI